MQFPPAECWDLLSRSMARKIGFWAFYDSNSSDSALFRNYSRATIPVFPQVTATLPFLSAYVARGLIR
jgi:hypothetical protein